MGENTWRVPSDDDPTELVEITPTVDLTTRTSEGADVAATMQRLVARRIAAGHATEEATIRAELVAAVSDAMETADKEAGFLVDWDCMADETVVDWKALAEAAVDTVVQFFGKPRERRMG